MERAMKWLWKWLAGLLPMVAAAPALAAGGGNDIGWGEIMGTIDAMRAAGYAASNLFIPEGMELAGFFLGVSMLWVIVQMAMGGDVIMAKVELLRLVIAAGLALFMMTHWSTAGRGEGSSSIGGVTTHTIFVGTFEGLQGKVWKATLGNAWLADKDNKILASMGKVMTSFSEAFEKRKKLREKAMDSTEWYQVGTQLKLLADEVRDVISTFFMQSVAHLLVLVMMVVYVAMIFLGDVMSIIGMILGPLMVATACFERLKWLFDNWLKLMISAGFYKIIAAIIMLLNIKTIDVLNAQATAVAAKFTANTSDFNYLASGGHLWLTALVMIFYLLLGIWMMMQVGRLSDKVMNGQAGLGAQILQGGAGAAAMRTFNQATSQLNMAAGALQGAAGAMTGNAGLQNSGLSKLQSGLTGAAMGGDPRGIAEGAARGGLMPPPTRSWK